MNASTVIVGIGLCLASSMLSLGMTTASWAGDTPTAGNQIVEQVCSSCHQAGLMGAPRIGDTSAWQTRLSKAGSVDALAKSAEHGKGNMPPRGGEPDLTHEDLKAAIQYMLTKSGE